MTVSLPFMANRQGRMLPERRSAGPMPWVIAIMMFLTVLAAAAGLGLRQASSHLRADLAARITVQVAEADPAARAKQTRAAMAELQRLGGVTHVQRVDPAEMKALLEPWLGAGVDARDLPMPDMIDVDLAADAGDRVDAIADAVRAVAPSARVDQHGQWLAPLDQLLALLKWLALALVLLMATATACTVVLAARAALDNHRPTIDVMHLLGATDFQIAGLFQRRIALDALFGGAIGFAAATLVVIALQRRIAGLDSELMGSVALPAAGWVLLILLPLAGTGLAMLTARRTILGVLGRIL
jgi:cell division transport system permease protein